MFASDGYEFLLDGPVTVVAAVWATSEDRKSAWTSLEARERMASYFAGLGSCDYRHLHGLYTILHGDLLSPSSSECGLSVVRQVLEDVGEGRLLVIPGWSWGSRRVASPASAPKGEAAKSREERILERAVRGRKELSFDGTTYLLLAADSWRKRTDLEQYEVVRGKDAASTLDRMASRAQGLDEKAALIQVQGLVADNPGTAPPGRVVLLRRKVLRSYVSNATGPALTPSQMRRSLDWVEFQLVDGEGNPVPDAPYRLTLPDRRSVSGVTDAMGMVRVEGVPSGDCELSFEGLGSKPRT